MPHHQFRYEGEAVQLRFEQDVGKWGPWSENLRGPAGRDGMSGGGGGTVVVQQGGGGSTSDASVPYYIAAGEIYTVPIYRQALFARNIEVLGYVDLSGDLIEVA